MTCAEELAKFVVASSFEDLSGEVVNQLKIRVLDGLGCAIGALSGQPVKSVRKLESEFGGLPFNTLIGGGKSSPDRAAFYNGALVRYLDFNDSFLSKDETCHPSDNIASALAASEYADASGKEFLVSLAVAYQVQCRLSEVAPLRDRGFDHVTQGAYAVAAGVSKALGLDVDKTANALAISGFA
jgi:2-methylcitrate dehydratase